MLAQNPPLPSNVPSTLNFSFGDFGTRVLEGTEVKAIAVLKAEGVNQGKIIGVISTSTGTFKLFRLNKSGVLDTTFGPTQTGYSEDRFGETTSLSTPSGLTVIDNDQILVTGHVRDSSLAPSDPAAALFNQNGSANLVFGKFRFNAPVPTSDQMLASADEQTSSTDSFATAKPTTGKILFCVKNNVPGPHRNWGLLIQLTLEGTLDTALAGRGYIFFRHNNQNTTSVDVVTQTNGRIILAGSTDTQGFLAGYTPTGQIDISFGKEAGITPLSSVEGPVRVNKILLQPDDKLIAVGTVSNASNGWISRKRSDGNDDPTFNDSEDVITKIPFRKLQWTSAAIDSNGAIVASGEADARLCIVGRITKDGLIDTTFSHTGISDPNAEHTPNRTTSIGLQSSSQIIVAGGKASEPSVTCYHG